jgi:hypothetical protein
MANNKLVVTGESLFTQTEEILKAVRENQALLKELLPVVHQISLDTAAIREAVTPSASSLVLTLGKPSAQ